MHVFTSSLHCIFMSASTLRDNIHKLSARVVFCKLNSLKLIYKTKRMQYILLSEYIHFI